MKNEILPDIALQSKFQLLEKLTQSAHKSLKVKRINNKNQNSINSIKKNNNQNNKNCKNNLHKYTTTVSNIDLISLISEEKCDMKLKKTEEENFIDSIHFHPSNFEIITPIEGVTISENGKSKKSLFTISQKLGKLTRTEYIVKVFFIKNDSKQIGRASCRERV